MWNGAEASAVRAKAARQAPPAARSSRPGLASGCRSERRSARHNNSTNNTIGLDSYSPTYHIDDELVIIVNALDPAAARPFNKQSVSVPFAAGAGGTQNPALDAAGRQRLQTYRVDSDGNINFPVLGVIKIAGLNRQQATVMLQDKLKDYIKEPIVDIETVNYRITVLGEVVRPGTYTSQNERITILEALSLAGDLTIYGERENVLVIQDYDGKKTYTRVNLKSDELFDSPVYYLSQNDVVYVEPNKTRARNSAIGAQTGVVLSSLGLLISMTALVVTILNNN
jgi:polysaccharide export outer membrane protein